MKRKSPNVVYLGDTLELSVSWPGQPVYTGPMRVVSVHPHVECRPLADDLPWWLPNDSMHTVVVR